MPRPSIRGLMIVVALAAAMFAIAAWMYPRKHHCCVNVEKGIACITYYFDTDDPDERANFESLVKELESDGRRSWVEEY
jgi:hypothetical protein